MDLSLLTPDQINQLRLLIAAPVASQAANPNSVATIATPSHSAQAAPHTISNAFGQYTPSHLPQAQPPQPPGPVSFTIAPTPMQSQAATPAPPITQLYTGIHTLGTAHPAAPTYPPAPPTQPARPAQPAVLAHPAPSGFPPPSAYPAPGGFQPFLGVAGLGLNLATGHANQARLASSLPHSNQRSLPIRGSRAPRGSGGRGTGRRGNASRPPSLTAEEPVSSRKVCLVQDSSIPSILVTVVVLPPLVRIMILY